jgi:hypothetical protein
MRRNLQEAWGAVLPSKVTDTRRICFDLGKRLKELENATSCTAEGGDLFLLELDRDVQQELRHSQVPIGPADI